MEIQKTENDTNHVLESEDYIEAYGDGFPQDEVSQGAEKIKVNDISRPFDPGFQNAEHTPLTKTHSGESL